MGILQDSIAETSFIFLMAIGVLIMLALALAFVLFVNHSQKKIMAGEMKMQELALQYQEELLHSTILTQEDERKRIARELHDEIGSKLNVILLNLHHFQNARKDDDRSTDLVAEMKSLINKTIDTTRRISHDLLPPTLEDFGLVEAIKELVDAYQMINPIKLHLDVLSNEFKFSDSSVELNLFRVIQELVSNSIKHGAADDIFIEVSLSSAKPMIVYRDNGKGFDLDSLVKHKGLGMKNIESRLKMTKAEYQLESSPGNGIKVSILLTPNT